MNGSHAQALFHVSCELIDCLVDGSVSELERLLDQFKVLGVVGD